MLKRLLSVAAVLCVLCVCILSIAEDADSFHPMDIMTGETRLPVELILSSPRMIVLSQYDENRLDQLNRLLKHLSLGLTMEEKDASLLVMVDGMEAWSSVNGYADADDDTVRFLGQVFEPFNLYLNAFYPVITGLREAYPEKSKSMEANLNLSGYGRAVRKILITIPAEEAETAFRETLLSLCENTEARAFLSKLVFSGQQKISFMLDQDDREIRINYDGKAGLSQEDIRSVSLVWKCLRNGNHRKDGLSLKTPAQNESDRFNVTLERDLNPDDPQGPAWQWTIETDDKSGPDRSLSKFSMEWKQEDTGLNGTMVHNLNKNGAKTSLSASATLSPSDDGSYTGGVEITHKKGKIEKEHFSVEVSVSPSGKEIRAEEKTTAESISAENRKQPDGNVNRELLRALLRIPDEDLLFLFSGLPEEEWQKIVQEATVSAVDE